MVLFCPGSSFAQEVTVAAAANLQPVLEKIKTEFEKNSNIKLRTVIGSSGQLTAQVENGAPFDIFMSADLSYPEALYKKKLALEQPKIYAYGILILWTLKPMDLSKGMEALSDPKVKKIAIANPQTAPYGREAIQALKYYQLYPVVEKKLVYGESIAQTNQFIISQAADIGFTAKSTVLTAGLKEKGYWIEVDPQSYHPMAQGVVILKHADETGLGQAKKFYDFLFSKRAKDIFRTYGYLVEE